VAPRPKDGKRLTNTDGEWQEKQSYGRRIGERTQKRQKVEGGGGRRTRAKDWIYLRNGWGDCGDQGGVRKPSSRSTWP